jgi:MGT family glycosyltransferase
LAQRRTHPIAVVAHTALGLYLPAWQQVLDAVNLRRAEAGRPVLPAAAIGWAAADRLLVMSLSAFDRSGSVRRLRPRYLGPVADPRGALVGAPVIARQPGRALVVLSHSTDALQNDAPRLQRCLDALADLPVLVLASTSGVLTASDLRVPQNANVVDFLPMDLVLTRASLLVCHAGHGTTMAALRHGVPLVAIPGIGRDQAPIAGRVAELGLGLALSHNATTREIAAAARAVLLDQQYRERARAFARRAAQSDGADRAAVELERMCRNRGEHR